MRRLPLAALFYLLFAAPAALLVAPTMPPFQNADEANHLYRADQISHLGLLAQRLPDGEQGGWIDCGLPRAAGRFSAIPFHVGQKVSRGMYRREGWGRPIPRGFPNTAIYPPCFYLPQALALSVARGLHMTVPLVLLAARAPLRSRLAAVAAILAAVLGWALLNGPHVVLPVSPAAQARGLIAAPWRVFSILAATARAHGPALLRSFIGEPGWLDVDLPDAYHALACLILAAALLLGFGGRRSSRPTPRWRPAAWAGLLGILAAVGGVMLVQYLTWTATGAAAIEGLQGRYFIPPALMLVALAPASAAPARWPAAPRRLVLLFPLLGLPVLIHALLLRYYL